MMLIAAIAIWLTLIAFFVVLCRGAASADGRDLASADRYPTATAPGPRSLATGLVLLEEQPAPIQSPGRASRETKTAQDPGIRPGPARLFLLL